ncbi:hypothetical protein ABKV19_026391 [Rosa sericea]
METKATQSSSVASSTTSFGSSKKTVWVWTESKQVMTAAVERGWNTFLFQSQKLADDWSSIALIDPLLIKERGIFDSENTRVATVVEVSNPKELEELQPENGVAENVVVDLLDWQNYTDHVGKKCTFRLLNRGSAKALDKVVELDGIRTGPFFYRYGIFITRALSIYKFCRVQEGGLDHQNNNS